MQNITLIGESPAFLETLEHVSRAAPVSRPVLVIGERGTGKELIASRLHYLSARWEQPLIKVNCAALTESILESELFGHEAGAFTGANRQHLGHFERADGGTLILDELGTVSMRVQEKVLRVIEYGEFERVGGSETQTVDVRLVAATNEDLQARVRRGTFRADLLDRLAFDVITVPPLRKRQDDILPLAHSFAVNMCAELGRSHFAGFSHRAASTLLQNEWPGNVRELKNAVERSVYRSEDTDDVIDHIVFDPFDSPFALVDNSETAPTTATRSVRARDNHDDIRLPADLPLERDKFERRYLIAALARASYSQKTAAGLLSLTYHQFRARLKKLNVDAKPDTNVQRDARRRQPQARNLRK
ncbi:MAG: phage shock protein operon transcriptional activator [Pseudomonadota bacterium]